VMTKPELRRNLAATAHIAAGWHRCLTDYQQRALSGTLIQQTRESWLAERYRLAGLLWATLGETSRGLVTFPVASELARQAAAEEITPEQMLARAGL
jgi:hypothetical protein